MAVIAVYAETPSALADPRIVQTVVAATPTTIAVIVSWHPERGWLCSATGHTFQPCAHTAGLVAGKSPEWLQ